MRGVWPWLLLTACYSGGAIEIHVDPGDSVGVVKVELFVAGVDDDNHLEPLRPEANPVAADAVWWTRDPSNQLDIQPMAAEGVTYPFKLGGVDDDLEVVIAVGYDAGDHPVAMASYLHQIDIPHESAVDRYILRLAATDPLPRTVASSAPGLQLWGPNGGDKHACVQIDNVPEIAESYEGAQRAVIVAQVDDPDCDSYTDSDTGHECASRAFMAQSSMSRNSLSCARSENFSTQANPGTTIPGCIGGGTTCVDGTGTVAGSCSPSAYCAPTPICAQCPPGGCTIEPGMVAVPHIECVLPSTDATNGGQMFCSGSNAYLNLKNVNPNFDNIQCDDGLHAKMRKLREMTFATRLDYVSTGAKIEILPVDETQCTWNFNASGAVPTTVAGVVQLDFPGVFAVPLTSPVKGRGIALPIVFKLGQAGCTAETLCRYVSDTYTTIDLGIAACVNAPVVPGTEVID